MRVLYIILSVVLFCSFSLDKLSAQDPCVNGSMTLTYDSIDYVNGPPTLLQTQYNGNYSYQWYLNLAPIPGADSSVLIATTTGLYYVQVTGNSCVTNTGSVTIYNSPVVNLSINPSTGYICEDSGDSISFTASSNPSGASFEWYNSNNVLVATGSSFTTGTIDTYRVVASYIDGNGMVGKDSSDVILKNYNPTPINITASDTNFCNSGGLPIVLSATPVVGVYSWNTGSTQTSSIAFSPGWYHLHVIDNDGCEHRDSIELEGGSLLVPPITTTSNYVCDGVEAVLSTPSCIGCSYQWFEYTGNNMAGIPINGATDTAYTINNINAVGDFYVVVEQANGCKGASAIINIQNAQFTVDVEASDSTFYCDNDSVLLTGTSFSGGYYTWFEGSVPIVGAAMISDSTIWVNNSTVMGVNVEVVKPNGCLAMSNTIYIADSGATLDLGADTVYLCQGDTTTLNATMSANAANVTYVWRLVDGTFLSGSSGSSYDASLANTYVCEGSSSNGACIYRDTIVVENYPALVPSITTTSNYVCNGVAATISTSFCAGCSYQWYEGGLAIPGAIDTAYTVYIGSGSYHVVVVDWNGCVGTSSIVNIYDTNFTVEVTASDTTFYCDSDSILLTGTSFSGGYYTWFEGNTPVAGGAIDDSTLWVNNSTVMGVNVEVVKPNGCLAMSNSIYIADSSATLDVTTDPGAYCNGLITASTSPVASSYQWMDGNGSILTGEIDSTFFATQPGTYIGEVTYPSGCVLRDTIVLGHDPTFNVEIQTSGNLGCPYAPDTLTAFATGGNTPYAYLWNSGEVTESINVSYYRDNGGGVFMVTVVDPNGCYVSDSFEVVAVQRDTIDYILAPDSMLNICATLPLNPVECSISSAFFGIVDSTTVGCYDYTAGSVAEVIDTLLIQLVDTSNLACRETEVRIGTASCVWAGDADDDQVVDNVDVLYLGMSHGSTGTTRVNAGIDYDCEPSYDWAMTVGSPAINVKYSDTDGSGLVDDNDTMAIAQNWGLLHLRGANVVGQVIIEVDTATVNPGDDVDLAILMHDTVVNMVSGAYGLAFTINYDIGFVDTNTVYVGFDNSWIGTVGVNAIGMYKDFYDHGQTEVVVTRTDHQNVSGVGEVARMNFTIKDDVILRGPSPKLNLTISNVTFIDSAGLSIGVSPHPSQVLIIDPILAINTPEKVENKIVVYPNPSNGNITIQSKQSIEEVVVYNALGQPVCRQVVNGGYRQELNLKEPATGIYWIVVKTQEGLSKRKILIK
ncbi:MAG: T9SS type A sorting domain-containing protein [Aureispira sp.]|nr:T9SS type A sorting domain-containing protein [Aureispira sp.]